MNQKNEDYYFSQKSLDFLIKAGRQKKEDWLNKNKSEYNQVLRLPFIQLAEKIKQELRLSARAYHFPTKGLGRIKRASFKVAAGQSMYKDWLSMIATRPSRSRFESNPHLFFGIFPNEDQILVAGGLYMPTSQQTALIREAISEDASPFHHLFSDPEFKKRFKSGFSSEDKTSRIPKGFPTDHPDIEWIKLKRFIVMKKIPKKLFFSKRLADQVIQDYQQALRLNQLIDQALAEDWPPRII
jgi:uncharacterized protein (TIGR02453 family)